MSYRPVSTSSSFFTSLFDFSFQTMITPTIVKVLYIFVIAGAGLTAVMMLLSGITAARFGGGFGVVFIVLAPALFLVMVIYGRVLLEVVITFFRMGDDVAKIRDRALE